MRSSQQQQDPLSQAMAILQVLGQRRASQASIDQGQQRLALEAQQLGQQGAYQNANLGLQRDELGQRGRYQDASLGLQEKGQQQNQTQFELAQAAAEKARQDALAQADTHFNKNYGLAESNANRTATTEAQRLQIAQHEQAANDAHRKQQLDLALKQLGLGQDQLSVRGIPDILASLPVLDPNTPQGQQVDAIRQALLKRATDIMKINVPPPAPLDPRLQQMQF